jgi:hypothetical protein
MLLPQHQDPELRRLIRLFRALAPADRRSLLAFGEFLAQGGAQQGTEGADPLPPKPLPLPRPEVETVIGAIRRLSRTYPMLDRGPMLHETSALMSAHVLHGREAAAIVDELEALFARRYRDQYGVADSGSPGTDPPG